MHVSKHSALTNVYLVLANVLTMFTNCVHYLCLFLLFHLLKQLNVQLPKHGKNIMTQVWKVILNEWEVLFTWWMYLKMPFARRCLLWIALEIKLIHYTELVNCSARVAKILAFHCFISRLSFVPIYGCTYLRVLGILFLSPSLICMSRLMKD